MSTKNKLWLFHVAGVKFTDYRKNLEEGIADEDEVTLVPEPENQYDSTAVRLEWNGYKLGYIPAKEYSELKTMIVERYDEVINYMTAKIADVIPEEAPWRMFKVLVEYNPPA